MLDDWCMAQKSLKKRLYLALGGRRLLERAAAVHCTAGEELIQARKWFPRGRGAVAPLIFDCSEYASLPGPEPAHHAVESCRTELPVILFLSRLHPKKRPEILIDAAKLLRDEGRAFRIIIAGSGEADYERALRQRVLSAGLDDVVFLPGLVTGLAKVSLFQLARAFVLPTSQENFGFVYLEALAAGTPVITTRGTDTWRELEESGGAIIVERDDPGTFARAIGIMLDDPSRARSMGAHGREWVFDHFAGDAILREFEKMYESTATLHRR
jgi:glycosyltransferase involved in cell wall biosynthesis